MPERALPPTASSSSNNWKSPKPALFSFHAADPALPPVASGGRYDALVGRFCSKSSEAAGVGFGFDIEAVRELVAPTLDSAAPVLVAYGRPDQLATALDHLETLHQAGNAAELLSEATANQAEAEAIGRERGCRRTLWIAP